MADNNLYPVVDIPEYEEENEEYDTEYKPSVAWDLEKGDFVCKSPFCMLKNEVIELESNYSVDNVKEAFLSALKTYYRTAKDNEEIRYTVVSALLSNTAGVIDFSGLKINSGTDNIAVAADYYPVTTLSDLDFTEG